MIYFIIAYFGTAAIVSHFCAQITEGHEATKSVNSLVLTGFYFVAGLVWPVLLLDTFIYHIRNKKNS